ncbi:hypothetical protein [Solimonas soli]|uniref:hypothetical protein n=1 Tax=Solimonas soli TaxID=413479 RepID=UPI000480B2E3|nr:hypothetical protein [Solimonas soli]
MLAAIVNATLRILLFRAGPQDFPYDPRLTAPLALLLALAIGLQAMPSVPVGGAIAVALATVAALGMVTRLVLRMRQLDARFHQTFAALLASNAVLTFLIVPFAVKAAPALHELASHPELFEHPEQMTTPLPLAAVFVMFALSLWNLLVNASIFRHAVNVSFGAGILIAFGLSLALQLFVSVVASLVVGTPAG